MSFSSASVSIPDKKLEATQWADSADHTKNFGEQAMGFYAWNVNLFYSFPSFSLDYSSETNYEKPYDISDTATMTIQILNSEGKMLTKATASFTYREKKWGKVKKDKDGNKTYEWNYLYDKQVSGLSFGGQKFTKFNGIKYIVTCKAKKKKQKLTRIASIRGAAVSWFTPVPCKNMVNIAYTTNFSVREVFRFGQFKDEAAAKQKEAEDKARKDAKDNPGDTTPADTPSSGDGTLPDLSTVIGF